MAYSLVKPADRARAKVLTGIHCIPKHWSVYTFLFSCCSLVLIGFFFFDLRTSDSPLLLNAEKGFSILQAQVSETYFPALKTPDANLVSSLTDSSLPKNADHESNALESETEDLHTPALNVMPIASEQSPLVPSDVENRDIEEIIPAQYGKNPKSDVGTIVDAVSKGVTKPIVTETVAEKIRMPVSKNEPKIQRKVSKRKSFKSRKQYVVKEIEKPKISEQQPSLPGYTFNESCDYTVGTWVWDESYPLYRSTNCPFLDGGFRCEENGRPDKDFMKWRWQPAGCDLPRFDAKLFLEKFRGSRLVYVGDSIGRNNWESMLCMLAEAVPNKTRIYEVNGEPITKHTGFLSFRFEDYDCTVEYFRSPYLVPSGRPPRGSPATVKATLKVDVIDWSSEMWKNADIIVFNAGHWWSYEKTLRGGIYFQTGNTVKMDMDVPTAFRRSIQTVASWVDVHVDSSKSQVFFRSYAPVHFRGGTWRTGGQCHEETRPLANTSSDYETPWMNQMISGELARNKKNPIQFVDITYLSEFRSDGHSSLWYLGDGYSPASKNRQDCSHWCLPGVPDTWNELLYANLLKKGQGVWSSNMR